MRFAVVAMLLTGCSATMVNPPGGASGSAFAPVNEAERPGVVAYLNQGASGVVKSRREDAYKKMHGACRGSYRIDAEGPQASGGQVIPNAGGGATVVSYQYWYIQFSCVRPTAAR